MMPSRGALLLAAAAGLGLFAAGIALSGGFDTRLAGIPVRARGWERPAVLSAVLALAGLVSLRRQIAAAVRRFDPAAAAVRAGRVLPALATGATLAGALALSTFAAGGSDSYGYVSQAGLLAQGRLTEVVPVERAFTWPDVLPTLTPLGFTPGVPDRIVPQYPPGLPLLMAPFARIHRDAVFLVVPLLAAVAVWGCARLGAALGDPLAGGLAAILLALSPTFAFQAVQPMSDVPVTACWTAALLLARSDRRWSAAAAGAVAGLAVLIRPNLAPLLVLVAAAAATAGTRFDVRRAVVALTAALPGLLALGAIQHLRFGSPLASGYGPFSELFSLAYVKPNLDRYPRWMTGTYTWFIAVWLVAPLWLRHLPPPRRTFGGIGYAFALAVVLAYLPYVYFQPHEWFYTRFLLPALPFMLLFGVCLVLAVCRRLAPRWGPLFAIGLMLSLATVYALKAASLGAFDLRVEERKFPAVGQFVRNELPPAAFVFAAQHSGSVRYYAGRPTIRWDVLRADSFDRAVTDLRRAGYVPFVVLDPDEEPVFRARFGASAASMFMVASVQRTRVFGLPRQQP